MANGSMIPAPAPAPAPARRNNTILLALAAAGGGFLLWKYWWVPKKFQEQMALEAALRQQRQPGLSDQDAITQAMAAMCQVGAAAQFGMPPQMTGDLCNALAPGAMALLKNSPKIINAALNLTRQGIRTIIGIHTDVAKGALNIAAMPFKMTFSAAKDVTKWTGGAVTDVTKWTGGAVSGVYSGAKSVVKDVVKTAGKILPWNW